MERNDEILSLISDAVKRLKNILMQNKAKDESIQRLEKELDAYRHDFAYQLYKPLIMALISYRESCRKEKVNLIKYAEKFNLDKINANAAFLVEELKLLMDEHDISPLCEKEYRPNPIKPPDKEQAFEAKAESSAAETTVSEAKAAEKLEGENGAEEMLEGEAAECENEAEEPSEAELINAKLNELIETVLTMTAQIQRLSEQTKEMIAKQTATEDYFASAIIDPIKAKVARFYGQVKDIAERQVPKAKTQEEGKDIYYKSLGDVIAKCGVLLTEMGVTIEGAVLNGEYNPQKHKLMKTVSEEGKEEDGGKIAARYTDCYGFNGKVIYQAKVDVYKK